MKRSRVAALVAIGAALVGTTLLQAPAQAGQQAPAAATATIWEDTFDGPAGQAPDRRQVAVRHRRQRLGQQRAQYYTNSTRNAALDGQGNLVITARKENPATTSAGTAPCQYTSARLLTAADVHPAVRPLRGPDEDPARARACGPRSGCSARRQATGRTTARSTSWRTSAASPPPCTAPSTAPATPAPAASAPAYTLPAASRSPTPSTPSPSTGRRTRSPGPWTATCTRRRTPADLGGNTWVFNKPFFLILNLAVGGYWPGDPDGSTSFPQQLVVDYVRVTSRRQRRRRQRPDHAGLAGKCVDVAGANTANGTPVQLYDCNGTARAAVDRRPATARSARWASAWT